MEAIYEADFLDCSYGFRPGRNCHQAVDAVDKTIMRNPINHVIDADIKGFFDNVLDLWFEKRIKRQARGACFLVRYADDFVCMYERENAERQGRRAHTFDFLGFTHFCGRSRRGKFIVGRRTSRKKFRKKCKELNLWLKRIRNFLPVKEWWPILAAKLRGHYQYYGVSGNMSSLQRFHRLALRLALKWLNRRSQRRSFSWAGFGAYLKHYPLPPPRIVHNLYTLSPVT